MKTQMGKTNSIKFFSFLSVAARVSVVCRCGQTNRSVGSGHSRRLTDVEEGRCIARRWVPKEELQAEEEESGDGEEAEED